MTEPREITKTADLDYERAKPTLLAALGLWAINDDCSCGINVSVGRGAFAIFDHRT
jgi:hypothetical protein